MPAPTAEEIAAARQVLEQAKVPKAAITAAEAEPEAFVQWALSVAGNDVTPEPEGVPGETAEIRELREKIAALENKPVTPAKNQTKAGLEAEVEQLRNMLIGLSNHMERQALRSASERLKGQYPQIAEAKNQERIKKVAIALVQSGEVEDVDSALERAATFVFGAPKQAVEESAGPSKVSQDTEVEDAATRLKRLRAAGSPTPATIAAPGPEGMTNDEVETRVGVLLHQGRRDEAKKLSEKFKATSVPFFG